MNREQFVQKLKSQLDEINDDIDALEARLDASATQAREEFRGRLEEAKAQRAAAEAKLQEVRNAGDEAWEDLKHEAEHAWSALKSSVNYFKSHFR